MSETRRADPAAERYLSELEGALQRTPGVVPADALADAREFLYAEIDRLRGRIRDEQIHQRLVERFGRPEEVAAAYATAGSDRISTDTKTAENVRLSHVSAGSCALVLGAIVSFVGAAALPIIDVPVPVPIGIPGFVYGTAHVSLWNLYPTTSTIAAVSVLAAGTVPLLVRRARVWALPLMAACVLLSLTSAAWMCFAAGGDGQGTAMLLVLFTAAAACLAAEALLLPPTGKTNHQSAESG